MDKEDVRESAVVTSGEGILYEEDQTYKVRLLNFDGPLELLLHLIRKHKYDIYDIPIASILKDYLETLEAMHELDIDLAGDSLVMAATLTQIKSRLLLPPREGAEQEPEGEDPRAQLVARLIEYRKFKDAAQDLGDRENFWREVFVRQGKGAWEDQEEAGQEMLFNFGLMDLLDAFKRVVKSAPGQFHDVGGEGISITERMGRILEMLENAESITFEALFEGDRTRAQLVVTFLALLELARIRAIRLMQVEEFGVIRIMKAVTDGV